MSSLHFFVAQTSSPSETASGFVKRCIGFSRLHNCISGIRFQSSCWRDQDSFSDTISACRVHLFTSSSENGQNALVSLQQNLGAEASRFWRSTYIVDFNSWQIVADNLLFLDRSGVGIIRHHLLQALRFYRQTPSLHLKRLDPLHQCCPLSLGKADFILCSLKPPLHVLSAWWQLISFYCERIDSRRGQLHLEGKWPKGE